MRDGSTELDFGNGHQRFRLGWRELILLQERLDAGPYLLLEWLVTGRWRVRDIAEVIRCGLIGAGMAADRADKLVRRHVEGQPPVSTVPVAALVLNAALEGNPEENKLGEAGGEIVARPKGSTISPTGAGVSLRSGGWRVPSVCSPPNFSACRCGSSSPTSTAG